MTRVKASWLRSQVVRAGRRAAVTFSDISEAKATEERYEHLAEFTRFSLSRTHLQHRRQRIWTGLITAMNVAAEKLSGYSREELVGKAPLTRAARSQGAAEGKELGIDPAAMLDGRVRGSDGEGGEGRDGGAGVDADPAATAHARQSTWRCGRVTNDAGT